MSRRRQELPPTPLRYAPSFGRRVRSALIGLPANQIPLASAAGTGYLSFFDYSKIPYIGRNQVTASLLEDYDQHITAATILSGMIKVAPKIDQRRLTHFNQPVVVQLGAVAAQFQPKAMPAEYAVYRVSSELSGPGEQIIRGERIRSRYAFLHEEPTKEASQTPIRLFLGIMALPEQDQAQADEFAQRISHTLMNHLVRVSPVMTLQNS